MMAGQEGDLHLPDPAVHDHPRREEQDGRLVLPVRLPEDLHSTPLEVALLVRVAGARLLSWRAGDMRAGGPLAEARSQSLEDLGGGRLLDAGPVGGDDGGGGRLCLRRHPLAPRSRDASQASIHSSSAPWPVSMPDSRSKIIPSLKAITSATSASRGIATPELSRGPAKASVSTARHWSLTQATR